MNTTAIRAALSLCPKQSDREMPAPIARILSLSDRFASYGHGLPEVADLAATLFAADVDDFEHTLDDVSLEYDRRVFIHETNRNGWRGIHLEAQRQAALTEALPTLYARLQPVFAKAASELTKAAKTLPAGAAALEPSAVLEADAGSAFHAARAATQTLVVIGNAFPLELRMDGSTPQDGSRVAAIASLPETEPSVLHPLGETSMNAPAMVRRNNGVKRVVAAYAADPKLCVLDIARGAYGEEIRLELVRPDEAAERIERISRAHMVQRQRESA